jgi:hypothetical protein
MFCSGLFGLGLDIINVFGKWYFSKHWIVNAVVLTIFIIKIKEQ